MIAEDFSEPAVATFLKEVVEDAAARAADVEDEESGPIDEYRVNVVLSRSGDDSCPMIDEDNPTARNLLGAVEPK